MSVKTLLISIDKPYLQLNNVSLRYERTSSFSLFTNTHLRKKKSFLAIDDVSFSIQENETVGIIGRNGSGKSTISRLMSKVLPPNEGIVKVKGKVHLLALGVGFQSNLTGRDNVYVSGTLQGMSKKQVSENMQDIEDFAELGDFFDEPVRTYSSGMRSRLGFAVSTAVKPEILILDEVLSTGDQSFKNKAKQRMELMRSRTKIVILVSHSISQVKEMCTRVIWLEKGQMMMDGDPEEILKYYEDFCKKPKKWMYNNREKFDFIKMRDRF